MRDVELRVASSRPAELFFSHREAWGRKFQAVSAKTVKKKNEKKKLRAMESTADSDDVDFLMIFPLGVHTYITFIIINNAKNAFLRY